MNQLEMDAEIEAVIEALIESQGPEVAAVMGTNYHKYAAIARATIEAIDKHRAKMAHFNMGEHYRPHKRKDND